MKKLFLFVIVFVIGITEVSADVIPSSSKSIRNYGIGVLKIEKDFNVYSKADENSRILTTFILPSEKNKSAIVKDTKKTINPFIVNIPKQHEFFVSIEEFPENDWIKIYYNQNGKEIGWVKFPDKNMFLTWKEFVFKYGKKNGLVLMRDVPASQFRLYAQDSEEAQVIEEFTYPEYIALRMIRGNWMLVTIVDAGTVYKTGWFKWRSDDGKLRVFPKMK